MLSDLMVIDFMINNVKSINLIVIDFMVLDFIVNDFQITDLININSKVLVDFVVKLIIIMVGKLINFCYKFMNFN